MAVVVRIPTPLLEACSLAASMKYVITARGGLG